jgi:hypothetical protein
VRAPEKALGKAPSQGKSIRTQDAGGITTPASAHIDRNEEKGIRP